MDISGGNLIVRNNNLYLTQGDASINGNLILGYDASLNRRLFIGGDASFNSKLFASGDASFNNRLFVGGDASFNNRLFVGGDVSMNSRLFVASDASINGLTLGKGGGDISYNTAFGYQALYSNTTGLLNTAIGYQALTSNTTGAYNTAIGFQGLFLNTTGGYNTSLGNQTLFYNTTGGQNTAVGRAALLQNTGSNNTAIGYQAGYAGTANTTGSYNTYIGMNAQANANNYSNSTALGSGATITASNQVVLGTTSETVKYNKLAPLYTSVPTYTSSDVGYIYSSSVGQTVYSSGTADFITISNLAVGVYIVKIDMLVFDPGAVGVGNYINIEIRKSGTTLTYTSKAFGGISTTSWVNSPLSLSAFLTSSGTDSITVNRSSNISYNAYWYFQYIRIA
jgi:hypothetical protein